MSADRRSSTCMTWRQVGDRRIVCHQDKGHEGPHDWNMAIDAWLDWLASEGIETRDNGPYNEVTDALRQFGNWQRNMPMGSADAARLLIHEALVLVGLTPSKMETEYLANHGLDPIMAQILAGWIVRAKFPEAGSRVADQEPIV